MKTGYPRFFVHRDIVTLSNLLVEKSGCRGLLGLLTAQRRWAEEGAGYLAGKKGGEGVEDGDGGVSVKGFSWAELDGEGCGGMRKVEWEKGEVYLVTYPEPLKGHAKDFWQHTGWGISSRYAQALLAQVDKLEVQGSPRERVVDGGSCINGSPAVRKGSRSGNGLQQSAACIDRKTPVKTILRDRISRLASSARQTVNPCDVSLYPTGMTAIAAIARVIKSLSSHHHNHPPSSPPTIIIYGFLYLDTFKLLSKIFNFSLHLLGHSSAAELSTLTDSLRNGTIPNVVALFCEFPGNPLLRTPDLSRIRSLADEFGFMVVCDDTVGTFVNVDVLGEVDVLVSSLTKMFSGGCDVMGGSLIVNTASRWCGKVMRALREEEETNWYPRDAEVMERNSRDFGERMGKINGNARRVYEMMERERGKQGGAGVREVFYPLGSESQHLYERWARRFPSSVTTSSSSEDHTSTAAATNGEPSRHEQASREFGYGYLLSLTFHRPQQAVAFYDALDVAKGPSLGTNFTLACAYTLFAHYREREWAAGFGVEEFLVRVSVGMEDWEGEEGGIREKFERALRAAEAVGGASKT